MISVVARLQVKEPHLSEFRETMTALMAEVRDNEPGCPMYQLCSTKDPLQFVMVERYTDEEALGVHMKTPHFKTASAALGKCLAAAPQIEVLHELT